VPCRGKWHTFSPGQQALNRSHVRTRALGERVVFTLNAWRLLRRIRCSTIRITELTRAFLAFILWPGEVGKGSWTPGRRRASSEPAGQLRHDEAGTGTARVWVGSWRRSL
jgi:hypothetical protein